MRLCGALGSAALWLAASTALAAEPTHTFRYEAQESVGGRVRTAYRVDFRMDRAPDGRLNATVLDALTSTRQGPWTAAAPTDACRTLMRAPRGALARVQIWPAPADGDPLGPGFLDGCAPSGVFFPLTDILNIALIPLAPQFGASKLRDPGQVATWPELNARFDRSGRRFQEHVPGGRSVLVSASQNEKILDWLPEPAALDIEERSAATTSHFKGVETWAFRVRYDPRSGDLHGADATLDNIDLVVLTATGSSDDAPHVRLTRRVSIYPTPQPRSRAPMMTSDLGRERTSTCSRQAALPRAAGEGPISGAALTSAPGASSPSAPYSVVWRRALSTFGTRLPVGIAAAREEGRRGRDDDQLPHKLSLASNGRRGEWERVGWSAQRAALRDSFTGLSFASARRAGPACGDLANPSSGAARALKPRRAATWCASVG